MKFDKLPWEARHIDMTPLVDAIFAIILFLLVAASFVDAMEQDLSIDLPTQGREVKVKNVPARPIVVNVRNRPGGPQYVVENTVYSVNGLRANLSKAKLNFKDPSVVIRGDRNVKWDHVAKVMSCCADVGITKVSAAVAIEDSGN